MVDNGKFPIVTVVACLLVVIAACVGAAVVIWGDPGALSFNDYLNDMAKFVGGLGIVAIGRGIHFGLRENAGASEHVARKAKAPSGV